MQTQITEPLKKDKWKNVKISIAIILLAILLCFADSFGQTTKQLPRIDSIENGKRIFTDENGNKFDVARNENGRSYIVKDNKRVYLFRKPEVVSK